MLVGLIVLLSTVFSVSNALLRSERFDNECSKPLANFNGFKNVKKIIPNSTELNCRRNGANETFQRMEDHGRRLSKRDDVGKHRDNSSEAFILYDWWNDLSNNHRKKVAEQDPICNSVKRVCFDELMNAQLSNKSCLSPFHYQSRFLEPLDNIETNNYFPWSATLTDLQMVDTTKDVVNSETAGEMTTVQDFEEPMESTTIRTHFLSGTTVEIPIFLELKKSKNKTENNWRKNENDTYRRLILKLKENRKGSRDSKTPKPFGNFSIEILENVGSGPTQDIDESTFVDGGRGKNRLENLNSTSQIDMNLDEKNDSTVTVKSEDEGKVRVARSLYPNPSDTRQFHLMHGLYSGNGAQMEDALRKAQIQAINVAYELEHSNRLRQPQADIFGSYYKTDQQQIVPEFPNEIISADRNDKSRNFKRKINQNPVDFDSIFNKQLQERMQFLDELNLAILKKKEELDLLSRMYKNNQFSQYTDRLPANTNTAKQFVAVNPLFKYVSEPTDSPSDSSSLRLLGDISLPRNINNFPIPSSANNLSSSLISDPSFDAIIKAYANNYLPSVLPQKNTSDYSLRKKREIHEDGLEEIPSRKSGYFNTSPLQSLSKEDFINSLRELEELQKLLSKQYDHDYGSCNKRNGKRWLIPKKESEDNVETVAPKSQFENSNIQFKKKSVQVVQPAQFITEKRHNRSEPVDYYKKFTVLENDLLDLKNSLASINCEQAKVDKSDNDTNNIYVQVNVSVALFNGSSTPPVSDGAVGKIKECPLVDGESTKDKKINVTETFRKNKKTQDSKIEQWKALDKKRDLHNEEKQNIVDNKFSCCEFNAQNFPNINSNIRPSKSFNRKEAIKNLNRQFEEIEKDLLEDTKNICQSKNRVSLKNCKYCNTKRRSVGEYLNKSNNDRVIGIKKFRPCNDYHMKNDKWKSDRIYRDRGCDGHIMNYRCRKQRDHSFQLEANRNSFCNNILNLPRCNNKTNAINCKKKTGLLRGKLTEPSLIETSNDAKSGFTETIETRVVKPGIKNFTIILNRKRKNCEFDGGSKKFFTKYIDLNHCPDNITDDYFKKKSDCKRNMSNVSTDTDYKCISKRYSSKFVNKFWKTLGENESGKKLIQIKNPYDKNVRRNEINNWLDCGKESDRGLIENLKNGGICNFAETNHFSDDFNIGVHNFNKVDTAKNTWHNLLERNSNSREKFIACTNVTEPGYSRRDKRSVMNESYPNISIIKNFTIPLHVLVSDGERINDAVKRFVRSQYEKQSESSSYAHNSKRQKPYDIYNSNGFQQRFYTSDDTGGDGDLLNHSITIERRPNGTHKGRRARNTRSPTTVTSFDIVLTSSDDEKRSAKKNRSIIINFADDESNADGISTTEFKDFETNTLLSFEQTGATENKKTDAFVIDMAGFEDETSAVTNDDRDISKNFYCHSGKMNTHKYKNLARNKCNDIRSKSFFNPKDEYSGELLNSFDVTLHANKPDNIDNKAEVVENNIRITLKDVNPRENEKEPDKYSHKGKRGKSKFAFKKTVACQKCFVSHKNVTDPVIKDYHYFNLNNAVKGTTPRRSRKTYKKSGRTSLTDGMEMDYDDFYQIQTEDINLRDEIEENKSERNFIKTTCAYFDYDDRERELDYSMEKETDRDDSGLYLGKSGWDESKEEDADSYTMRSVIAVFPTEGAINQRRKGQQMKRLHYYPQQRGHFRFRGGVHRYTPPFPYRRSFLRPRTVTDTIYINKYSVKIGRRYRTEPPFHTVKPKIDQLSQIRDCSRKFKKSVLKYRESLRRDRVEKHNDYLIGKRRRGRKKTRKYSEDDCFTDRRQLRRYPRERNQIDSPRVEQITASP